MRFRLKNKSYTLNTKIKIVGKNGASLSTISTEINNPTSNYNLTTNTITFCLSPLPAVIGDPEVIVNEYTTSALDFENGLIDKIPTTIWQKEGTADITSVNKIFGQNSFETKALGDSLYTNSNIITGGSTPFTIEFYALIKDSNSLDYTPLFSKNNTGAGFQFLNVNRSLGNILQYFRQSNGGGEINNSTSNIGLSKIKFNEINKFTMTYDGSALRFFVNNSLDMVLGTTTGLKSDTGLPFSFLAGSSFQSYGLVDNINIHDGIATKVREPDPYEEFLVVDLAFDGENNSTKIVDNGSLKSNWLVKFNNPLLKTSDSFNNKSALYLNGIQNIKSDIDIFFDEVEDFTFSFEFVRISSSQGYIVLISTNTINYQSDPEIYSINAFTSNYPNSAASYLRNKLSFIDEKNFDKDVSNSLISKTNILDNVKYKIDIVRKNKITYLYINNVLDTQTNIFSDRAINFGKLCIGHCAWSETSGYAVGLNGYIKNFKIYKGVAVIPENPTGKIQLDFDNNLVDKYGNSTWTNNGVTFDQVNSVKGHAAYFNNGSNIYSSNTNLNFEDKNFKITFDFKSLNVSNAATVLLGTGHTSVPSSGVLNICYGTMQGYYFSKQNGTTLSSSNIVVNQYYKSELNRKNNVVSLYLNDVIVGSLNCNGETFDYSNNGTRIGYGTWASNSSHNGYIDNFKSIKDYKENVIIDKPAVHLPLETNSINTGFTPLTINSVGSPTYTTVDGKKCIKFESGKYLTINSNNIFNFGTNSDFYIEFDSYLLNTSTTYFIANQSTTNVLALINNGIILNANNTTVFSNITPVTNRWVNIKIYRKNNTLTLEYDGISYNNSVTNSFDLSSGYTTIGAGLVDSNIGYMSNFKMFVGTSEIPETYNDKKVLDLDFKPTRKSYLFKDNNSKCIIHPVNIAQRDYQNSQYCCSFNGTDQYLQLGKNDLFNFGNDDFIINFKIKPKFSLNSTHNFSRIFAPRIDTTSSLKEYIMLPGENYPLPAYRGTVMVVLDEQTVVFMATPRLSEAEVNNVTLVRSGNLFSLYLNEIVVEEKTFTGDFNLNRYDETIIGASKSSSEVVSYLNATIYSIKILRNTSDLSLIN